MSTDIVITEENPVRPETSVPLLATGMARSLPAEEGHLITLLEPEEVNSDWKRWSAVLLRPDGLYGTKPATGGNKAGKLKAIRAAPPLGAPGLALATDCDRGGS